MTDLRRWVDEGLILQPQMDKILRMQAAPEAARRQGAEGINGPTILYYVGAVIALSVIAATVGLLGALAAAAIGGVATLRWTPYRQGGSLLVTIAVALIPFVFVYLIALAGPDWGDWSREQRLEVGVPVQMVSLALMIAILIKTRIAMVAVAVSGQLIALAWTTAAWSSTGTGSADTVGVSALIALTALLLIALNFGMREFGRSEESFWFGLSGHVVFFTAATTLMMSEWGAGPALLYFGTCAAFVVISARLPSLMFLLSGVAGVYVVLIRVAVEAFGGTEALPWALVAVGLSMTALAMGYQRWRYDWHERQEKVDETAPPLD